SAVLSRCRSLSRNLFLKRRVEQELHEEVESFVTTLAEEKIESGMAAATARRAALVESGGGEQIKEEGRALRAGALLEQFVQDLGFGLRLLGRAPGVSVVVILCLTLAIGANTTVFSWIEGILLRPYALVRDQDRMMALTGTKAGVAGEVGESTAISWPDFVDLQRNTNSFDWFIVSRITGATLNLGDHAEGLGASIVSSNYFE